MQRRVAITSAYLWMAGSRESHPATNDPAKGRERERDHRRHGDAVSAHWRHTLIVIIVWIWDSKGTTQVADICLITIPHHFHLLIFSCGTLHIYLFLCHIFLKYVGNNSLTQFLHLNKSQLLLYKCAWLVLYWLLTILAVFKINLSIKSSYINIKKLDMCTRWTENDKI
jgi:hypothetical protein